MVCGFTTSLPDTSDKAGRAENPRGTGWVCCYDELCWRCAVPSLWSFPSHSFYLAVVISPLLGIWIMVLSCGRFVCFGRVCMAPRPGPWLIFPFPSIQMRARMPILAPIFKYYPLFFFLSRLAATKRSLQSIQSLPIPSADSSSDSPKQHKARGVQQTQKKKSKIVWKAPGTPCDD